MPTMRRAAWFVPRRAFVESKLLRPAQVALAIGALFGLSVVVATTISLWDEREQAIQHCAKDLLNLGHALAEQAAQALETIDLSLRSGLMQLADVHVQASDPEQRARVLRAHSDVLTSVTAIGIYSPNGERRSGTSADDDLMPRSLAGSDALAVHRLGKSSGLDVSMPMRIGPDRKWHIVLSRRIDGPRGEFHGIIAAMLDMRSLAEIFKAVELEKNAYIALLGWNQVLLTSIPWRDDAIGKSLDERSTPVDTVIGRGLTASMRDHPFQSGRVISTNAPVRGYPLILSIAMDRESALSHWYRNALVKVGGALTIGVLALALAAMLGRHLRRRDEMFAQLNENQAELTEAQRIARLGSFSINANTGSIHLSPQAAGLLGVPAPLLTRPDQLTERVLEDDRPIVARAWADLTSRGRLDAEFRVAVAPQGIRWLRARAERSIEVGQGKVRVRGTLADITDERRAQEAVQHAAAVVESTDDAILSVTPDMRVLSWNPAASRAFGYSAEEVVGRHLTGIMVASEAAEAQCLIERTVKGEIANAVETALTVKGGKKIRIAVSLSPLPDAAGNITAITAVVRDVSARHAADRRRAMEYRIVQLLAESRPIAETMPAVLASLCRSLKLDYGRYWQRDQDAELVQCESIHPKRGSTAQAMLTTTTHCVRRLADLRSETWSDGQPRCVRLSDSENDVRPSAGEGGAAIGVLLVPVTLDANTIAILEFAGDETSLAMPELLSIARVVGAQIGQYLQRRRAEDELRAEKEYIDHVIASAPALIACIMPDGTTRSVNQSIRDITQYSPEELDGRNFWDVLYAGGPYQQIERLLEAACAGGIADYPLTIRTRAGELRDLSVSAAARHSSDGSVAEYVLVCADVTSRRLGEARRATEYAVARALSEEQSEAEAIPRILRTVCAVLGWDCGIYRVFDPATRVVSCPHAWHNDAPGMAEFVETLSRPRVLQLGSLYWLTIDTQYPQWNNDVRSLVRGAELRVAAAGADLRAVISVPVQGGERPLGALQFFGRSSHKPEEVLIEAMQVIGHQIGQFVERKRIEVARQQTDERLRGIADNIPGIVFEYHLQPDGSARFEYVSERANDVLDVPAAELMNDPRAMFSLIDPGHRRKVLRSMQSSRRNLGLWSVETPIRTRGGQIKWVRGQSMPKQLDDGTVIWYGVIVDVTVQKQAENAIQHMNEQLERRVQERTAQLSTANRELESFAYSVSHDLRAPLRSIDGFSRILMEEHAGKLEPVAVDYLGRVVNASQRMGQLIDDLLALSQVTRSEVTRVRTNLSVIATGIIAELRMESPARNVDVSIHPDMICLADPNLVRIALSNLLGNAWKFTAKRDRASIELGMLSRRNQSVYYVRDNGAGFDMRHAEKLFGAFQRLHSPREFEGTGVGLATVSRIVERHGGRVWAESSVDLGATFYFTLAAGTERR